MSDVWPSVSPAACGRRARAALDLGLPDGSGVELLRRWRREGVETPVLILTARDLVEEKVEGLPLSSPG